MLSKTAFLALAVALVGCHGEIKAKKDTGGAPPAPSTGRLVVKNSSDQAAADTDNLKMTFGSVRIHVQDPDEADNLGSEWVELTGDAGTFTMIEQQPQQYTLAQADVPPTSYDAIDVEIVGATYTNADGQVYDVNPPPTLSGDLQIDTSFCVTSGGTTELDSNLQAQLGSNSPSDWYFNLDATIDDHLSCGQ